MKNIEIKTTQNVVLQYELADLRDRMLAFLIDFAAVFIFLSIVFSTGVAIFASSETAMAMFVFFMSCIFIFYSLAFETLNKGQSLGKMALRIQVIKTVGGRASFADYAARWVFRMVDIYFSLGGIACILIASSSKAQRIGDIVANTAVVRLIPKTDLNLKDLLAIKTQQSYTPQYLQAKQLVEEDVLLIKSALDRYKKFNNRAHREALILLAEKIEEIFGLETPLTDKRLFLQTVLHDYVVLTR